MNEAFAIWPDDLGYPTAFFRDLEDATMWGLSKYGSDRFSIRLQLYEILAETDVLRWS